jgi:beta-glucanase (GH16 family)
LDVDEPNAQSPVDAVNRTVIQETRRRMRPASLLLFAVIACSGGSQSNTSPCSDPAGNCGAPPPPPVLVWQDEFDGPQGTSFDHAKWAADTGGSGFGNQEREFYTTRTENAALDGNGHLVITAIAEPANTPYTCWYGACRYTSTRLKTQGVISWTHGRFEARIKVPRGQGMWPAFWMLGADIGTVGWPQSGEIDIMENIGKEPSTVHGTIHGPGYSGANGIGRPFALQSGSFSDDFHVFAVEWRANYVAWYVDGTIYHQMSPQEIPSGAQWVFEHPFFILLNLAVGGAWPGDPDGTTTFPQQMVVDYVRIYK